MFLSVQKRALVVPAGGCTVWQMQGHAEDRAGAGHDALHCRPTRWATRRLVHSSCCSMHHEPICTHCSACTAPQAIEMGTQKASLPAWKTFSMALLAGAYVGFGGFLAMSIGANCPELAATNPGLQKIIFGAFGLPLGLTMVVVCGECCLSFCEAVPWGFTLVVVCGAHCLVYLLSCPWSS